MTWHRLIRVLGACAVLASCEPTLRSVSQSPLPDANLVLSTTLIALQQDEGGPPPQGQRVDVSDSGAVSATGLAVGAITYVGSGTGWLSASLSSTQPPASLHLTESAPGLGPGTYTALVPVISANAQNSPQNVLVNLEVVGRPVISVSPDTVFATGSQGGIPVSPQPVYISNVGGGSLSGLQVSAISYEAGQPGGWLSTSLSSTAAPTTLDLTAAPGSLPAGTYEATVTLGSTATAVTAVDVVVRFVVVTGTASPEIHIAPSEASFTAVTGGLDPVPISATVTNSGGGTLTGLAVGTIVYSGPSSGWLSATLNTGTAPATLTLQPSTGTLAPGTYTATVPVTSSVATNSGRALSVTFSISGNPSIQLTPGSVTFSAISGGSSPGIQAVGVSNSGGGILDQLQLGTTSYNAGQPSGWLQARLSSSTAPTSISLQATVGSLQPGSYTATVPVTSLIPSVATRALLVTFNVTAAGSTGSLVILTGDNQAAYPDSVLTQPLVVRVYDQSGHFAPGVTVAWTPSSGKVLNAQTVTDQNGQAQAEWQLGSNSGPQTLQASAPGRTPVNFSAIAFIPSGSYPNEPAGFKLISDRPFDAKIEAGWGDRGDPQFSIQQDASAPWSPPNVGQALFPAGYRGGRGPINTWAVIGQYDHNRLYMSFWLKISSNFVGGPTNGVNKVLHIWINGGSVVVFSATGQNLNPLTPQMRLQNVEDDPRGISFNLNPNKDPGVRLSRGQWHRMEVLLMSNTPGQPNGVVRWWVDGVLAGEYQDVGFISDTNTTPGAINWQVVSWNPTWGGPADTIPADQTMRIDHFYLSGYH